MMGMGGQMPQGAREQVREQQHTTQLRESRDERLFKGGNHTTFFGLPKNTCIPLHLNGASRAEIDKYNKALISSRLGRLAFVRSRSHFAAQEMTDKKCPPGTCSANASNVYF